MKKIIILLIIISDITYSQDTGRLNFQDLDPFDSFPQNETNLNIGKYGLDTLQCEENLTIYNEFYKQKSYSSALNSWFYLFIHAPKRTKNIYIHGAAMYKSFIKNEEDSIKREILINRCQTTIYLYMLLEQIKKYYFMI